MRKCIPFLMFLLLIYGCEIMEEINYVLVNVTGTAIVYVYSPEIKLWVPYNKSVSVEMSLIKDGGERIEETGTTGATTGRSSIHGSFNLYKEQPIDFKAKLADNPMVYGSDRVEWDYVDKNRKYGGKNKPDVCNVQLVVSLEKPSE